MTIADKWSSYRRILCVRTDNAGDVLMTEPALRAIKFATKDRTIDLLTSTAGEMAAELIPYVREVITMEAPWNPGAKSVDFIESITRISENRYDAAVIFNVYSQSPLPAAMLCRSAGIPDVAAFCRENPYALIPTWFPDPEPLFCIRHETDRQLMLAIRLGCIAEEHSINISIKDSIANYSSQIIRETIGDQAFILIHPGVSEHRRQYPPSLFAKAAALVHGSTHLPVLCGGSKSEIDLCTWICDHAGDGVINISGRFSFEEYAAVIKKASVLISNNTGPVHLAEAVGCSVVVLYAQTNPQHTPRQKNAIILPFDIPEEERSKNTLIRFAHERSFSPASMVDPQRIVSAVKSLLKKNETHHNPDSNL